MIVISHIFKRYSYFILVTLMLSVSSAQAAKIVPLEGAEFHKESSLIENMNRFKNKSIVVYLKSGASFSGRLTSAGRGYTHIGRLKGRDFSDALILTSEIIAFETPVRGYPKK